MKKVGRSISILIMTIMIATPFMSFATEEASFVYSGNETGAAAAGEETGGTVASDAGTEPEAPAYGGIDNEDDEDSSETDENTGDTENTENTDNTSNEPTEVIVAGTIEELSEESDAANDNEAFFTIDVSKDDSAELATEEVSEEVSDILSGSGSSSKKQKEIIDTLEDSGLYRAEGSGKSKVEVTSRFACQRLKLTAPREEVIDAYGAVKAVYFEGSYLLSYDSMESAMQAYDALVSGYGEDAVSVDLPVKLYTGEKGWGTSYMRMNYQKTLAENNAPVTVAVIDSGIQKAHPVFSGRTILDGKDFVNNDNDPADDNGHGTEVCGVIAESTPANVSILPIKAMDAKGEGSYLEILHAVRYAEEHGADIINMSLGGYIDDSSEMEYCDDLFGSYEAMIICAAGNENRDMDAPGVIEFPGELSSTVCVGSITAKKERSPFSNYGQAVDFAAPGSSVMLAKLNGTYGFDSGTSFSSPYLASAAAIVKAGHGDYNNEQIFDYLSSISEDIGDEGRDVYFGNGCPRFPEDPAHRRGGSISGAGITSSVSGISNRTYDGTAKTQTPAVIVNGEILEQGTDYEIQYRHNVNAGTAGMTIIGIGEYYGEISGITFTIYPKTITPAIALSGSSFSYTGGAITPGVTVRDVGRPLIGGIDYTVAYSNNVNTGTGYVNITCKGNYRGSGAASFGITQRNISPTIVLSRKSFAWNNRVQTPSVAVYDGGTRLPASQYSLTYSRGRRNVGEYRVKATLKGNYSGSRSVAYSIVPKGTGISGIAGARRAVTVKWARQREKMSSSVINGYQVQVSTDSKFRKNNKITTFKGYNNNYNSVKRLAAGKRYYVRVRTYKTVGKKHFYSNWSRVRSIRTR